MQGRRGYWEGAIAFAFYIVVLCCGTGRVDAASPTLGGVKDAYLESDRPLVVAPARLVPRGVPPASGAMAGWPDAGVDWRLAVEPADIEFLVSFTPVPSKLPPMLDKAEPGLAGRLKAWSQSPVGEQQQGVLAGASVTAIGSVPVAYATARTVGYWGSESVSAALYRDIIDSLERQKVAGGDGAQLEMFESLGAVFLCVVQDYGYAERTYSLAEACFSDRPAIAIRAFALRAEAKEREHSGGSSSLIVPARELLTKYAKADPNILRHLHWVIGRALFTQGKYDEATAELATAFEKRDGAIWGYDCSYLLLQSAKEAGKEDVLKLVLPIWDRYMRLAVKREWSSRVEAVLGSKVGGR